jgi:hypothetical protein
MNDEFHGTGTYTSVSGKIYEGDFVHGERNGVAKITLPSGDYYEGQVENGLYHGEGGKNFFLSFCFLQLSNS